jgi:hypothetical protein
MESTDDEAKAAFYEKRRKWIDYICTRDHISDRGVPRRLLVSQTDERDDKRCWYTHKQIAKILGMSHDKVLRAITELEDDGVMVIVRDHRKANSYTIRMPYE